MKRLILLAMILCASGAFGQALPYVPRPAAVFVSTTGLAGSWNPLMGNGTSTIPNVPTPAGLYCSNDGTGNAGTWVPCPLATTSLSSKAMSLFTNGTISGTFSFDFFPALPQAITVVSAELNLATAATGCTTFPTITVFDTTAGSAIASATLTASTNQFAMTINTANVPSGHVIAGRVTVAGVGCTGPSSATINVFYN